jgi:hypothetical protein
MTTRTVGVNRVARKLLNTVTKENNITGCSSRLMRLKGTDSQSTPGQDELDQQYQAFKKSIPAFNMPAYNAFVDKYSKTLTEDADA